MPGVAPSQRVREEITRLLEEGLDGKEDVTSTLIRLGPAAAGPAAAGRGGDDFLGRERYVRHRGDHPHRGHRTGMSQGPCAARKEPIPLQIPQVRETPEPYQSTKEAVAA